MDIRIQGSIKVHVGIFKGMHFKGSAQGHGGHHMLKNALNLREPRQSQKASRQLEILLIPNALC